jgi:hypothetical protein
MELVLMLCLFGLTVLVTFTLLLMLVSAFAARIAAFALRKRDDRLKWQHRIKLGILAMLLGGVSYSGYTAVYPPDSYFLEQFANASMHPVPASARVTEKSASYPDFHGDYCSYSRIELSPSDYTALMSTLDGDRRLRQVPGNIADGKPAQTLKSYSRQQGLSEQRHLSLQFMNDRKSIEVNVCVS